MRVCASESERRTYVCPDDMLFHEERRAIAYPAEITFAMNESYVLKEIPLAVVLEYEFDIVNDWQALAFLALKDIQEVASGKLTDWREENHLGEKSLLETFKREQ